MSAHSGATKPAVARYVNRAGAEIRITEAGPIFGKDQYQWFCTGCHDNSGSYIGPMPYTRRRANEHADTCWALAPDTPTDQA